MGSCNGSLSQIGVIDLWSSESSGGLCLCLSCAQSLTSHTLFHISTWALKVDDSLCAFMLLDFGEISDVPCGVPMPRAALRSALAANSRGGDGFSFYRWCPAVCDGARLPSRVYVVLQWLSESLIDVIVHWSSESYGGLCLCLSGAQVMTSHTSLQNPWALEVDDSLCAVVLLD